MPISISTVSTPPQITLTAALAKEIWTQHYTPIIGKAQVEYMIDKFQTAEAIKDQIAGGYEYFLIYSGSDAVGYFSLLQQNEELFLSKIYILKIMRGRGFGRRVMEYIELQARERSLATIRLTVNKNNTSSISAYLKMGFKKKREVVIDIGGGFVMDDFEMVKDLT